jgi:hypothetical protein
MIFGTSVSILFIVAMSLGSVAMATVLDDLGVSIQQYPTGTITEVEHDFQLGTRTELGIGAGANFAYHGNQGVQENETGEGFGLSAAIRLFPWENFNSVFIGSELSIFRMRIDWSTPPLQGTSTFYVVQPTVEIGRYFLIFSDRVKLGLGLKFGYEINTFVQGAPTGQGPIGLAVLSLGMSEGNRDHN